MQNIDVLVRIQNDKIWMQYKNEWYPLNTKTMEGYNLSLIQLIKLKLIELEDYSNQ